jgi:hypothetical protein
LLLRIFRAYLKRALTDTRYNGRADKKATGLGLYLSRQTADKLGIRLWAKSKPGEGSIFYLDLHK